MQGQKPVKHHNTTHNAHFTCLYVIELILSWERKLLALVLVVMVVRVINLNFNGIASF